MTFRKTLTALTALTALAVAPHATAAVTACGSATKAERASGNLVDVARSAGSFETLLTAAKAAGLVPVLTGDGPYTVFAPTDEAFRALPAGTVEALLKDTDKLKAILTYHVVPGRVMAADVVKIDEARTVNGERVRIRVDGDTVKVDDARVVKADVKATNGVIHVIDKVILPSGS